MEQCTKKSILTEIATWHTTLTCFSKRRGRGILYQVYHMVTLHPYERDDSYCINTRGRG